MNVKLSIYTPACKQNELVYSQIIMFPKYCIACYINQYASVYGGGPRSRAATHPSVGRTLNHPDSPSYESQQCPPAVWFTHKVRSSNASWWQWKMHGSEGVQLNQGPGVFNDTLSFRDNSVMGFFFYFVGLLNHAIRHTKHLCTLMSKNICCIYNKCAYIFNLLCSLII